MGPPTPSAGLRFWISGLPSAVLFVAALVFLGRELGSVTLGGLLDALGALSPVDVLLALAFTAVAVAALAATDLLAAREAGATLPRARVAFGAFLGWAFSTTLGSPLFGRAPVRHRLYTAWGMEPETVDAVVRAARFTLVTGFLVLLGWGLLGLPGFQGPLAETPDGPFPPGSLAAFLLQVLGGRVPDRGTRVILALGAVLLGLGGGWPAPAAVLVLVLLAPARGEFFRPTALTREPLSAGASISFIRSLLRRVPPHSFEKRTS